ncbi:hypothetical protein DNH61_22910 [Paenibacillus sambharensis]|uniref:Uncharacterized protein n=1 Tax=Paenibacillus sambharensis TaxID=1803190 RepID=A0A2W1L295_9BACL|nr:hypothetical protein [Paenibacillus sambharensis]PZD93476.1 hypothetical protein DNH61_22910 [Paenibacillus sambharensis]
MSMNWRSKLNTDETPLVRSARYLKTAMLLTGMLVLLRIPMTSGLTLAEELVSRAGLPIFSNMEQHTGLHYVNIVLVLILFAIITLLVNSLNRHRFLAIILLYFILHAVPGWLLTAYQSTLASGVHALMNNAPAECRLKKTDGDLHGNCSLALTNYSSREVTVTPVVHLKHLSDVNQPYTFETSTITIEARSTKSYSLDIKPEPTGNDMPQIGNYMGTATIELHDGQRSRIFN